GFSAGGKAAVAISRLDMSKEIHALKPVFFPEEGTDLEQAAMAYHAERCHETYRLTDYDENGPVYEAVGCGVDENGVGVGPHGIGNTQPGFMTNGSLPIAGAPFQDPCIDDTGAQMVQDAEGSFYGSGLNSGGLDAMWNKDGMTTHGSSPFNSTTPRLYKAANVQFDAVLNKLGYHFPQQRIITLWQDVVPTVDQERPPEPFVLRMNTFDCTVYVHSNVVPKTYELDDYQVRTPTDIIGQHIHLPKWDLVSADGSANGFNYEDGTLSPEAVVELIHAINTYNADNPGKEVTTDYRGAPVVASDSHNLTETGTLEPADHPFFGQTKYADRWVGARSTMQRWFADPVVNVQGVDRGLGIIFTHDHYGPSTHQQIGLYATVLIEPAGSKWMHNETGTELYTRTDGPIPLRDGGPTSWQAAILTGMDDRYTENVKADKIDPFREFYFEYTDFQHAYQPGVYVGMTADQTRIGPDGTVGVPYNGLDENHDGFIDGMIMSGNSDTYRDAIAPPVRKQAFEDPADDTDFPMDIWEFPPVCVGNVRTNNLDGTVTDSVPRPCPEAITADDPGLYVVNYRNESVLARVYDPNRPGPDANGNDCSDPANRTGCGMQAEGKAGGLAFALDSNTHRQIDALNTVQGLAPASYFDSTPCSNGAGGSVFCPPITNPAALSGGDPYTPMIRVMDGDFVRTRMQAGGQEEEHAATFYGLKWLQGGSGFGESKNSGWRNSQSGGISEQFALKMPVFADYNQRGNQADYLYSFNTSIDGWASGTWGILRSYKGGSHGELYQLPNNEVSKSSFKVGNAGSFDRVCPTTAPKRSYDLTAISANHAFGSDSSVTIQDLFPSYHVGGAPDSGGGSLIYNSRETLVSGADALVKSRGTGPDNPDRHGPLHDPTGIIYVQTDDLVALDQHGHEVRQFKVTGKRGKGGFYFEAWGTDNNGSYAKQHTIALNDWNTIDDRCFYDNSGVISYEPFRSDCPVRLRHDAPREPVVIRANAGECIETNLRNKVLAPATYTDANGTHRVYRGSDVNSPAFFAAPGYTYMADVNDNGSGLTAVDASDIDWDQTRDLATGNAITAAVRRERGAGDIGMTSFNNNLIQPSAHVGMYAQLLEMDVTRDYGINVGQNPSTATVVPGGQKTYKWYAGHIGLGITQGKRGPSGTLTATPVEFGGFGIMPADPIKQGQKGLYGAGAIYPVGSTWTVDAGGTTSASVTSGAKTFRDFSNVAAKGASIFYGDSYPVENVLGEGTFGVAEDSQDMGGMAINYGNEAMWFRFGRNPVVASGNAKCNGGPDHPGSAECLGGLDSDTAELAFHNSLVGGDPQTAVFTATPGQQYRMHVLMPVGAGRGSTFDLHGAVWQRDPYVCQGSVGYDLGLPGKCDTGGGLPSDGTVGSQGLGVNPIGFAVGAIESWLPGEHYEIFIPKAGGSFGVNGDYLFRDHMGLGNTGGLWGIVRVKPQ
ncbi:MAG: hypothetical protein MUO51_00520, partial [Woeseiaceae bacterium]|nr:hypothetical protein [Woeseiaceae bacterium]